MNRGETVEAIVHLYFFLFKSVILLCTHGGGVGSSVALQGKKKSLFKSLAVSHRVSAWTRLIVCTIVCKHRCKYECEWLCLSLYVVM